MDPLQNQVPVPEKKSFGPLIGIIIIIVVLVLGGLYYWSSMTSKEESSLPPISKSDDVDSIEQDLSAGSEFNADFSDIESDLQ